MHFFHLRTAHVQDSSFSTCLLNQPLGEPFRLTDEGGVPHIVFDDIVNLVFPTGLCCVNEVLSGSYGAGFVVHAQNVSCGDDTPGRIGSYAPAVFISRFILAQLVPSRMCGDIPSASMFPTSPGYTSLDLVSKGKKEREMSHTRMRQGFVAAALSQAQQQSCRRHPDRIIPLRLLLEQ